MWDPRNETIQELLSFLEHKPLDRMEAAFQEAARRELERRGVEVK